MIEWSGFVPLTNGSGSGPGCPKIYGSGSATLLMYFVPHCYICRPLDTTVEAVHEDSRCFLLSSYSVPPFLFPLIIHGQSGSLSLLSLIFFFSSVRRLQKRRWKGLNDREALWASYLRIHSRAFAEFEWALKLTNQLHYTTSHPPRIDAVSLKSEKVCTVKCIVQQWNSAWYC